MPEGFGQMHTEEETAKMLKKSTQSLRNDRHLRRGLPYVKFGRSVRYLESDIIKYIHMNRIDPSLDQ